MQTKAIFTGSFDPPTLGHLDIIERASALFDTLTVGVIANPNKKSLFSVEDRVLMLKESVKGLGNVDVCHFEGLLAGFTSEGGYDVIVRGLRNSLDFDYEAPMERINGLLSEKLGKRAETVFLMSKPEHEFISSSMVRELMGLNADYEALVPDAVRKFAKK